MYLNLLSVALLRAILWRILLRAHCPGTLSRWPPSIVCI